jgi:hypothetical protein
LGLQITEIVAFNILEEGRLRRAKTAGSDQRDAFLPRDKISGEKVGEAKDGPSRRVGWSKAVSGPFEPFRPLGGG